MTATRKKSKKPPKTHVSVIYFHGMGSQRRYEETSRLIDRMDAWLSSSLRNRDQDEGMLVGIEPRSEPHFKATDEAVTYIETGYLPAGASKRTPAEEVRFYEVYWAPIMAGSSSARRVATWIVRQVYRPVITLLTPWRERQRLRRAALADLRERTGCWPDGTTEDDFNDLTKLYTAFEGLDKREAYPTGKFHEFKDYLSAELKSEPDKSDRLTALSTRWLRWYQFVEIRNAFVLFTILLALVLAGGMLIWFALQLLEIVSGWQILADRSLPFAEALQEKLGPTWSNAAGITVMLLLTLGIGRFLTDYMGDVEAWATYEETDEKNIKRRRVIDMGTDMISHVLADPACRRVAIVSHSLGTTVAHDTVLAVTRQNQATSRQDPIKGPAKLTKLRHFVTIASPIDKINYFFESSRSKYHRYTRVVETLRGDIGTPPFSRNNKPYVHWVNYYDEADLIAGGLHSPVSRNHMTHRVDNIHISNLRFPNPGKAHSAYFENRTVISQIFSMIYKGTESFESLPLLPNNGGYDYESTVRGPGDPKGAAVKYHLTAVLIPWVGLVALICYMFSMYTSATALFWLVIVLAGLLVGGWLMTRGRDELLPL